MDVQSAPVLFEAVHKAIRAGCVRSCHDLSEGGLAVVLAAVHEPRRDIAVGRSGEQGGTWISEDGETWRPADVTTKIETLATGPAGTLGLVGTWSENGDEVTGFEVWKLVDDR